MGMAQSPRRTILFTSTLKMTSLDILFHLSSKTMRPCYQTKRAHAEAMRTILCPLCTQPKPTVSSIDVSLQERVPNDKPLNFLFGCGIGLIHRELLDLIGVEIVERDLFIGRVVGNHGKAIDDWATFRGREVVIVRGSQDAKYHTCPECGRNNYYAAGKQYLYPRPMGHATIFESDLHGLIVPTDVCERVMTRKWRRLNVDRLPVVDDPPDGLGIIPFRDPKFTDGSSAAFPN